MREYYEELWQSLGPDLHPPDLDLRAGFLLGHLREGDRVLDLGCGDGVFSELMLGHTSVRLTLADVAEAALSRARARVRLASESVEFLRVPVDGPLPCEDGSFDLVWASEVIEHVADTARWLSEVRRVLTPAGRLLLSTPNHSRLRLAWHGIEALAPPLGDHLHLYDRSGLRRLLAEFGFHAVEVRTAGGPGPFASLLLGSACR